MDQTVDVSGFLESHRAPVIATARAAVQRAHLAHYEAAGADALDRRLETLMDVLVGCCRRHRLDDSVSYAETLAGERHTGGYPLLEVQTVINVLEEAVWRAVMADVPAADQGYALAVVSTVLGSVKDALARGYLVHSGSRPTPLRVESLFSGSEGTAREV